MYLETLAEQGIIGFAALLALLGAMVWMAIRNLREAIDDERVTSAALLATICGLLFGGVFERLKVLLCAKVRGESQRQGVERRKPDQGR